MLGALLHIAPVHCTIYFGLLAPSNTICAISLTWYQSLIRSLFFSTTIAGLPPLEPQPPPRPRPLAAAPRSLSARPSTCPGGRRRPLRFPPPRRPTSSSAAAPPAPHLRPALVVAAVRPPFHRCPAAPPIRRIRFGGFVPVGFFF